MPDDPNFFDDSLLPDWMRDMEEDDASQGEPPGQPAAPGEAGAPAGDDWLSAFEQGPSASVPDDTGEEDLDWLDAADDQPDEEPREEAPAEPGVIPDWLNAARPPEVAPPEPPDEDLTFEEWEEREQERLREEQKTPDERLLEEVPDWFDEVAAAGAPAEGGPAEAPGEADFVPGWLLGLEDQDTQQAPDWFQELDLSAEAVTRPVDVPEPGALPPDEAPPGGDLPDWFAGIDLPLPGEAPSGEELPLPDLDSLRRAAEEAAESGELPGAVPSEDVIAGPEDIPFPDLDLDQPLPVEEAVAEDVGAWLADLQPAPEPEPEDFVERFEPLTPDEFTPAPVDEEAPAWLRDMAGEGPAAVEEAPVGAGFEAEPEEPARASVSEEDMDWLADLSALAAGDSAGTDAEPSLPVADEAAQALEGDFGAASLDSAALDQLLGLYEEAVEPAGEVELAAEAGPEMPGEEAWPAVLDEDLGAGMAWDDDLGLPAEPEEPRAADLPDFEALFGEAGPEGMPGVEEPFAAPAGEDRARPFTPPPQPIVAAPEPEAGLEPPEEPAAPGAQPEWVAELRPSDLPVTVRAGGAERSVHQKPLDELPDRLRAFREKALHDLGGEAPAAPLESGPLAGVAGALPLVGAAIPPVTRARSVEGLVVTPEQEARARRLQALMDAISAEDEAEDAESELARAALARRRRKSRLKPDRVLVALILLVALLVPFATDALHLAGDPPALAGDRLAVADQVDALEPGDYALFAFEYGPPSAGELDGLAEALLRDVLARGAVPLILSTDPLGAFHAGAVVEPLADDAALLAARGQEEAALVAGEDYAALAYLPGEAIGVRSLRYAYEDSDGTPKRHPAFDATLRGEATGLPISRVETDISLIVVIGGESEAVRTWAEQLEGIEVPKVALVTAALEPLVEPYVNEDGYAGYLAGYRDAAGYNHARNTASRAAYVMPDDLPVDLPNPEGARWHSMALGLAAAAGLIALGMVVNGVRALGRRRRR